MLTFRSVLVLCPTVLQFITYDLLSFSSKEICMVMISFHSKSLHTRSWTLSPQVGFLSLFVCLPSMSPLLLLRVRQGTFRTAAHGTNYSTNGYQWYWATHTHIHKQATITKTARKAMKFYAKKQSAATTFKNADEK